VVDMGFGLNSEIISSSKFYKWNIFIMPFLAVISISLNLIFIPQYAIVGSALATLISVFTYNVLRAIIVYKKLNIHSFSIKFIYVGILISLPIMVAHFVPLLSNAYLDIVINSGLVLILTILPIYFFRLSNEINGIVNKGLKMINLK
jgi:O-antigen/teichoic acid export membrane protein